MGKSEKRPETEFEALVTVKTNRAGAIILVDTGGDLAELIKSLNASSDHGGSHEENISKQINVIVLS